MFVPTYDYMLLKTIYSTEFLAIEGYIYVWRVLLEKRGNAPYPFISQQILSISRQTNTTRQTDFLK